MKIFSKIKQKALKIANAYFSFIDRLMKPFANIKIVSNQYGLSTNSFIQSAISVLMIGILLPVGLEAWESFSPTGATLGTIWDIAPVLIVLGIVLDFYRNPT